ncbi:uncharacterized protein LOC143020517 [Oratosquilla oratoria]|uniref:uncharacterized protein LOC143020517 n=1 Tax=Oratosquilla oratoria TaxID=337810 RepID=UPI003F770C37
MGCTAVRSGVTCSTPSSSSSSSSSSSCVRPLWSVVEGFPPPHNKNSHTATSDHHTPWLPVYPGQRWWLEVQDFIQRKDKDSCPSKKTSGLQDFSVRSGNNWIKMAFDYGRHSAVFLRRLVILLQTIEVIAGFSSASVPSLVTTKQTRALVLKKIPVHEVWGIVGDEAVLPCDASHPQDDRVVLLLWFRDSITTPIYSYDDRHISGIHGGSGHWFDEKVLGDRARLTMGMNPVLLSLRPVGVEDEGMYRCRVDFRLQPTKTTRVSLSVVVPPSGVTILEDNGRDVKGIVGPYPEGHVLSLTCIAHGGSPRPSVVWFNGTRLIDSRMDVPSLRLAIRPSPPSTFQSLVTSAPTLPSSSPLYSIRSQRSSRSFPSLVDLENKSNIFNSLVPVEEESEASSKGSSSGEEDPGLRERGPQKTYPPANTLTLGPLTRQHLKLLLTCEASNNNLTLPTSSVVMLDMQLSPRSVRLKLPQLPLLAGVGYVAECRVEGARPSANITWWWGHQRFHGDEEIEHIEDELVSRSRLRFKALPEHDLQELECKAEHPTSYLTLHDKATLQVLYIPWASLSFGESVDPEHVREGEDVILVCTIKANPPAVHLNWRHNNAPLEERHIEASVGGEEEGEDEEPGGGGRGGGGEEGGSIVMSGGTLILRKVGRKQSGRYSCHASNSLGDGSSEPLRLDVKYAPVCQSAKAVTYKVGRLRDTEVTCQVSANPPIVAFQWTLNATSEVEPVDIPRARFTSTGTRSTLNFKPDTLSDYGVLRCWASNQVGPQRTPCVFHMEPLGEPDPPSNCSVVYQTEHSFNVTCVASSNSATSSSSSSSSSSSFYSSPVSFLLTVIPYEEDRNSWNLTSEKASFRVDGVEAGRDFRVQISAFNRHGSSINVALNASSLQPKLPQSQDGPLEAEVREEAGGEEGRSRPKEEDTESAFSLLSFIVITLGATAGVVLVILFIIITVVARRQLIQRRREQRQGPGPAATIPSSSLLAPQGSDEVDEDKNLDGIMKAALLKQGISCKGHLDDSVPATAQFLPMTATIPHTSTGDLDSDLRYTTSNTLRKPSEEGPSVSILPQPSSPSEARGIGIPYVVESVLPADQEGPGSMSSPTLQIGFRHSPTSYPPLPQPTPVPTGGIGGLATTSFNLGASEAKLDRAWRSPSGISLQQ